MKNFGKDTIFTGQEIRKTSKSIPCDIHLDKLLLKDVQIIVLNVGFGCFKRRIVDVRGGWMQSDTEKKRLQCNKMDATCDTANMVGRNFGMGVLLINIKPYEKDSCIFDDDGFDCRGRVGDGWSC